MEQKNNYKERFRKPHRTIGVGSCKNCGKEFDKYYTDHLFCSKKCWFQHKRRNKSTWKSGIVKCEICGKEFTQVKPKQVCCSKPCRKIANRNSYQAQSKDATCKYCGDLKPKNKMRTDSCGKPECEEKRREKLDARKQKEKDALDTFGRHEREEIAELRKALGLPEIKDGNVECLSCKSVFYSENVKGNRICRVCKENETRLEIASVFDTFTCRTGWREREA